MASAGRMLTAEEYRKLWMGILQWCCGVPAAEQAGSTEFLSQTERRGWRALTLVALMGEMGLRVGEAVSVAWFSVVAGLDGDGGVALPGEICKGGRPRQVLLTPAAFWVLSYWRRAQRAAFSPGSAVADMWLGSKWEGLSIRGAQAIVDRLGRRFVHRRVGCHDLRRTFGERVRRVSDVRIAQLMLGHRRLESTERYLGGSRSEREAAAVAIDRDLWPDGFRGFPAGAAGALPALDVAQQ